MDRKDSNLCRIIMGKIVWKGMNNSILIIPKNIKKKIEKEKIVNLELENIDSNLEKTQLFLEKMDKYAENQECKKMIFSLKTLNAKLGSILLSKHKENSISFPITDYLFKLCQMFVSATKDREIFLRLSRDQHFPNEVKGLYRKFDISFVMLFSFFYSLNNIKRIDINQVWLDVTIEEFVLLFKLNCKFCSNTNFEHYKSILQEIVKEKKCNYIN